MLNRIFTVFVVLFVLLMPMLSLLPQPTMAATPGQHAPPPNTATAPADPDEFSTNGADGFWQPGDTAWHNDNGSRMPNFQDVLDYAGLWICGYYGCLGDRR